MTLATKVYTLRKAHDLTQLELAGNVGVTKACISSIELGKRMPSMSLLYKLAKEFNTTAKDLL
jgi:DNA-binding XRE family transcriptional regulator